MKAKTYALIGASTLLLAGAAQADILGGYTQEFDNGVAGIMTWDIFAVHSGPESTVGTLTTFNVNAVGGTFHNNALGGILPASAAFQAAIPALVYDSFFTIQVNPVDPLANGVAAVLALSMGSFADGVTNFTNTEGAIVPNATDGFAPGDEVFAPTFLNGQWVTLIARLSVNVDEGRGGASVNGTIGVQETGGDDLVFVNFDTIPAPGALALLGLAGLAGARRRRS